MGSPRSFEPPAGRRRFVSVGTKLALGTALVVTVISGLVLVELTHRERDNLLRAKEAAATNVADLFALEVAAPLDFQDADAAMKELDHLAKNRDVVYAAAFLEGHDDKPFAETPTIPPKEGIIDITKPIVSASGKTIGRALIVVSVASENAAYEATRTRIFLFWLTLTTLTIGLLTVLARRQIVAPLEALSRAAKRLERGETNERVLVESEDEIGRLARSFEAMQTAIVDREAKLAEAIASLRELYDSMAEGILAIDRHGVVASVGSRRASTLFPKVTLEGAALADLLYPGTDELDVERQALAQFVDLAFTAPPDAFDKLVEHAPAGATIGETELELEVHPIVKDGEIVRLMVLVTDASEKRRLMNEVQATREKHAKELKATRRLVSVGGQAFAAFLKRARERLDRCAELVVKKQASNDEALQHAHTIKGEARVFDLVTLANEMALVEDRLRELSGKKPGPATDDGATREAIAASIAKARAALDEAEELFVRASPIGRSALDQTSVRRQDVERLVELVAKDKTEIAAIAARLASRPFGESASILADKVPTWAEEQQKRARLVVKGSDVLVPAPLAKVLPAVLTHLVRNALAHGVEAPGVRDAHGKAEVGEIVLRCVEKENAGPTVEIEDDGAGLATAAILAHAKKLGLYREGDAAETLVFTAGFSTAPAARDAAGLGVGLSAVRDDVLAAGYTISIHTRSPWGTRFVLEPRPT